MAIAKSTDNGTTWRFIKITDSTQCYWGRGYTGFINNRNTIFVGGFYFKTSAVDTMKPTLYKSTNNGETWINVTGNLGTQGARCVYSVMAEPNSDNIIYIGAANGVYKTTDGGQNWSQVTASWLCCLAIDALDARIIYGTGGIWATPGIGVYLSTDAGQTWATFNEGLPTTNITVIKNDPLVSRSVYIGSRGRGTYSRTWTGNIESNVKNKILEFGSKTRRNPFTSFTTVVGREMEHFALYDISGKLVGTYQGNHIGADLCPGVYFLKKFVKNSGSVRVVKVK